MSTKSIGETRVRTEFNPSKDNLVDKIKQKSAELINLVNDLRWDGDFAKHLEREQERLISLAQTAYEEAAMWAVKSATY